MKSIIASATLSLATLAVVASPSVLADPAGWYIGGSLGQSRANIDDEQIASYLQGSGLTMTSISEDEKEWGYKLLGGYQFNRYFALESGYFSLGEFGFTANTAPPGTLSGKMEAKGVFLDPVLILPITERFSVLGRAGLTYVRAESSFTATGAATATPPPDNDQRSANYKFGLGLQYALTDRLDLRAEAERYRIDDSVGADNEGDIDLVSVGLVYRFIAASPAPVAATPPPPAYIPPPAPVPAAVETANYCSFLNIAFEINKGEIQREEKERLAVLGTFMTKYPDTTAVIEGHTDSVGTEADNQTLSEQRATSVVRYLVDEIKIAPSRLQAAGFGEGFPIGDNNTSEGKKANRRIVAVIRCTTDVAGLNVIPARTTLAMEMEFDPKSAEIEPRYRDQLSSVATFMKANPSVTATVEGHADRSVGLGKREVALSPEVGMELSKRRAQNVVNYLVDHYGIARSRLAADGFGSTRRATYGDTLAEQQENRRVNIIFNYQKQ